MKKYLRVWFLMSKNSLLRDFGSRLGLGLLLTGKVVRFSLFFAFLYFLLGSIDSLAGYTRQQVIFIFLTFNLVDILSQFLFREVYRFRPLIISGDFDLVLTKPIRPLFRSLMGGADFIDFLTLVPLLGILFYYARALEPSLVLTLAYALLVLNGIVLAAAFHIFILSFAVITLELDNLLWIFRELVGLGRVPVEIYATPMRLILTYIFPVASMIALPAKTLMGFTDLKAIIFACVLGAFGLLAALRFWKFALSRYTSASS